MPTWNIACYYILCCAYSIGNFGELIINVVLGILMNQCYMQSQV
jgi:hypothetical protein